jgi:tripartite-type tricarboxylate transporter receptor subunit TctC
MLLEGGTEPDYLGPIEFGQFLEEEVARWASVVKKANIKME